MKKTNRRFFSRQEFEILRTSLKVGKRTVLDAIEYEIPFEQIENRKIIQTATNNNFLVLAFFLLVIGLLFQTGSNLDLSIFLMVLSAVFFTLALITRRKTVIIPVYSGDKIELFYSNRTRQEVIDFFDQIIAAANLFLLNKYGKVDRALPIESQVSNLNFLRDRNIITEEEYESLKNQLIGRDNRGTLGFGK